ncbi:MAG: hypothetical protein ACP5E4_02115, partial [Candidatus Aenigmatarchaeota archaeon]
MRGQIFVLGALSVFVALFVLASGMQESLFLPPPNTGPLDNLATEYNYWLAYVSMEGEEHDPLAFGRAVKQSYPYVGFFYVLADEGENGLYFANFFNEDLNVSLNGRNFEVLPNSTVRTRVEGEVSVLSDFKNFTYRPESSISGAI